MSSPHRLLIVGAGLTGSATAYLLRKMFAKDILSITVWEKSRGAGGRMNTYRSEINSLATVDLGAQYISVSSADYAQSHERYFTVIARFSNLKRAFLPIRNNICVFTNMTTYDAVPLLCNIQNIMLIGQLHSKYYLHCL